MRSVVVALIGVVGVMLVAGRGPTSHRHDDDWGDHPLLEPEITGDNAKDEARWRHELDSDPWGDDSDLLTDDPPKTAAEYERDGEGVPPLDFVGPPAPPTRWENMQHGGNKFGKMLFSLLTVFVTLGMMAAPYLLMI